jgi:hypothetical protein
MTEFMDSGVDDRSAIVVHTCCAAIHLLRDSAREREREREGGGGREREKASKKERESEKEQPV